MKQLIWAIIIIVVLGGAYWLWQGQEMMPTSMDNGQATTTTDTGTMMGTSTDTGVTTGTTTPAPGGGVVGVAKTDKDPFDVTITYSDAGFSPKDLTIKLGQRVRFLNSSSKSFWPASGVHPTHTLYPEKEASDCLGSAFDACKGIAPGGFFDFTLNYVGTWPFHDHQHAFNSGSITVTQ